jgi:hypothetical protein
VIKFILSILSVQISLPLCFFWRENYQINPSSFSAETRSKDYICSTRLLTTTTLQDNGPSGLRHRKSLRGSINERNFWSCSHLSNRNLPLSIPSAFQSRLQADHSPRPEVGRQQAHKFDSNRKDPTSSSGYSRGFMSFHYRPFALK